MKNTCILFGILIEIVYSFKALTSRGEHFKPFISVMSPESLNQFIYNEKENPLLYLEAAGESDVEKFMKNITVKVKCKFIDDFNLYDISKLTKNALDAKPYYEEEIYCEEDSKEYKIKFNFCYDLKHVDEEGKQIIVVDDKDNSIAIADSVSKGNEWTTFTDPQDKNASKIEIKLNSPKGQENHHVKYILQCNTAAKHMNYVKNNSYYRKNIGGNEYETVIYIISKEACVQFDFYVVWKFIMDYSFFFSIVLIVFGLFNCILGKKFTQYTCFLLALFGVTICVILFSQYILPSGCKEWIIWVLLILGIIIGSTAGYFVFIYYDKVISFLVGGIAGFFLGEFLFNLFGNQIKGNATLINTLFIVGCIIILIIISYVLKTLIIILATAFIGSYAFIRGISLFAGGFPNIFTIISLRTDGETDQINNLLGWEFYVYLSSIVVCTGLSIYIQYKIENKCQKTPETPDANLKEKFNIEDI